MLVAARARLERRAAALGCRSPLGVLALGASSALADPRRSATALQFVYGWIPAGAAVAVACSSLAAAAGGRDAERQRDCSSARRARGARGARPTPSFFLHATRPQTAVYVAPFAALLLARLHLVELAGRAAGRAARRRAGSRSSRAAGVGLAVKDARAESAAVARPGRHDARRPRTRAAFQRARVDAIARTTRPGEPILLAPQLTALYTLAGRPIRCPQISLLPGRAPDGRRRASARSRGWSASARAAASSTDRHRSPSTATRRSAASFDRVLAAWITRNFDQCGDVHAAAGRATLDVWLGGSS